MPSLLLEILAGPERGRNLPLPAAGELILGREESDLPLGDPFVSARHCALRLYNGRLLVRDLGSRNGTFRNGLPLEDEEALLPEDLLRVGATTFRVLVDGARDDQGPDEARVAGGRVETVELVQREQDPALFRPLPPGLLRAVGNALGSPIPAEDVPSACLQAALTEARWSRACLHLELPDAQRWFVATAFPEHPLFGDVVDRVVATSTPALAADLPLDPTRPDTPAGQLFASAAAAPFAFGPGGRGWFYVDTLGSNRALRPEDLSAVEALGRLLGGAIARLRRLGSREQLARRESAEARARAQFLGESAPVRSLLKQIARLAQSDVTVLLNGETGTGKEVLARLLHDSGPRGKEPFLPVNCAALPDALAESLLFGHVKGAFTDARQDRPGVFREAGTGTVFLDEVGELSPALQAKLLRVLENREVVPLGQSRPIPVRCRVLSASHKALAEEVRAGRFREDLAFRLNVVTLEVPPLRARRDDVLLLAHAFLVEACERAEVPPRRLSAEAEKLLRNHAWPGNVRELKHVLEGAVLLSDGPEIGASDLRLRPPSGPPTDQLPTLREVEKAHILEVLRRAGGNKTRAARLLGVDRTTLYDKLKVYGL